MAPSLTQAADELYALPPADFTAARDELARRARAAGDREAAAQIRKLARPTVSAWLVNQLVRAAGPQMGRLYETGQSLHDAQQELAGDRLRELSAQRRQVIAELLPQASRLAAAAGVSVSPAAADEVRVTLEAALADANARTAVRSGQLTRALTYAGLGEVDLTAALAVAPAPGGTGRGQKAGSPTAPQARSAGGAGRAAGARQPKGTGQPSDTGPPEDTGQSETGQARAGDDRAGQIRRAVDNAEAAVAAATAELSAAEGQATSLAEQRQFLTRRVSHLRRELERAEAEESELARAAKEAQRAAATAAKSLARAQRELDRARKRAETA